MWTVRSRWRWRRDSGDGDYFCGGGGGGVVAVRSRWRWRRDSGDGDYFCGGGGGGVVVRSPKLVIVWWKSSSERLELCRLGLLVAVPIVYPQPWRRRRRVQKRRLEPFPQRTVSPVAHPGATIIIIVMAWISSSSS